MFMYAYTCIVYVYRCLCLFVCMYAFGYLGELFHNYVSGLLVGGNGVFLLCLIFIVSSVGKSP